MSTFDHRQPAHTSGGDDCPTPSTPIDSFTYDEDGNLRFDDQYEYVWDAENRLIEIATKLRKLSLGANTTGPDEGDQRLRFVYDYMGRRSEKTHEVHTSGNWVMQSGYPKWFIYDGWNVQLVLRPGSTYDPVTNPTDIVTERKYTWGLDLSRTFHGAGGIGGLLAAVETQGTSQTGDDVSYWYFYDANGNVGQLIDGTTPGTPVLAAHYEYDPYGNLLAAVDVDSSGYVDINPFRFSTKWLDYEIGGTALGTTITGAVGSDGLYYYGFRYYSPSLGRWIKRDPIGEDGGLNQYAYVSNNPTDRVDFIGLWEHDIHHGLTLALADKAGIACAAAVADGCNRPDEDERSAPHAFTKAKNLRVKARLAEWNGDTWVAYLLRVQARKLIQRAAEWHFPADEDGVVRPGSAAAQAKVNEGIKNCDFTLFSEGLHPFQDSWSHQGKPYSEGLGHARGAKRICISLPMAGTSCFWLRLGGIAASLSHSADKAALWNADVRATGMRTYEKMLEFKESCPCACPGPNGTNIATSSHDPEPKDIVEKWLWDQYPHDNVVD